MTRGLTVIRPVHFKTDRGKKVMREGEPEPPPPLAPPAVPRVSRLMALAIHMEGLVREGKATDYASLARLGNVTRARMTQIMGLLRLAPDIQEEILFLPRVERGRDPLTERMLRQITAVVDWRKQRRLWRALKREHLS